MKYISLFSGIGGFEVAIHNIFPHAECIGYSEIKKSAIKIYNEHFPQHKNLGNISDITNEIILNSIQNGCDLLVAGFPCTNLSSMARLQGDSSGLKGEKSGLFYELLRILEIIIAHYPNTNIIIENNASMSVQNRKLITESIQNIIHRKIYMTYINNADISVQTRKRLFWTTFNISKPKKCIHTWNEILEPIKDIKNTCFVSKKYINGMNTIVPRKNPYKYIIKMIDYGKYQKFTVLDNDTQGVTRYQLSMHSDTGSADDVPYSYPIGKSRPICAGGGGGFSHGMLIDRRITEKDSFIFRYFTRTEKERLFGFPDNYTQSLSNTAAADVLGNAVCVQTIEHILKHILV